MNKAVYISTSEPNSGKSIVTLGLMKIILGNTAKTGYLWPIIDDILGDKKDNHIQTVISHFDIPMEHDDAFVYTRSEFVKKRNLGEDGEIIDAIIQQYKRLSWFSWNKP